MDKAKLDELARLHAAATKGRMSVDSYHTLLDADGKHVLFTGIQTPMTSGPRQDQARANMAEYAAIHNAFPGLLEYVRGLEAERDLARRLAVQVYDDLPAKRDWLDPDLEKELRAEAQRLREEK